MKGHLNCLPFCALAIAEGIFSLLLALNVTGCTQSSKETDRATEVEAIRALDTSWVAAGQSKSVDAWAAFYSDDAAVLPPNEPIANSREAIRNVW